MFLELATGAFLIGNYVYHRWIEDHPKPKPNGEVKLPRIDEGSPIPMLYGKCRVRAPILIWAGTPTWDSSGYRLNLAYVIGIRNVLTDNTRLNSIYVGDTKLSAPLLSGATGNGNYELFTPVTSSGEAMEDLNSGSIGGHCEFLNGNPTQQVVNPTPPYTPSSWFGSFLVNEGVAPESIPGYRGFLVAYLGEPWSIGLSAQIGSYSFEVTSQPYSWGPYPTPDANPVFVIYDLLTGTFGKLGLAYSLVDVASFGTAAQTLYDEGHGYSRALEDGQTADEIIQDILRQIDGVLYEDPFDGMIKIKLIRADWTYSDLLVITPDNCEEIRGMAFGGWTNLPNKIRVVYTDRSRDYADNSVTAQNPANAVGQDGQVREIVLQFPGVCVEATASDIAARELTARSRPMAKCTAVVDRTFLRTMPGDVVAITWPEWGISDLAMRVAGVNRGDLATGKITLDLIQDAGYVYRGTRVTTSTLPVFPGVGPLVAV